MKRRRTVSGMTLGIVRGLTVKSEGEEVEREEDNTEEVVTEEVMSEDEHYTNWTMDLMEATVLQRRSLLMEFKKIAKLVIDKYREYSTNQTLLANSFYNMYFKDPLDKLQSLNKKIAKVEEEIWGSEKPIEKVIKISKSGQKVDINRLNILIDQSEEITNPDMESEEYSFINGEKGRQLNHIKIGMKEEYRIYKDILTGRNANFNQFKPRGTDMTNLRQDSELRLGTPEKGSQNPPPAGTQLGTTPQTIRGNQGQSQTQQEKST